MKMSVARALRDARDQRRAIGAFSVYTIDQAAGVIDAAEQLKAPAILQAHPTGRQELFWPLLAALRVIADESGQSFRVSAGFADWAVRQFHARGVAVEAELGRLSGSEDGLPISKRRARMTDPDAAARFLEIAPVDALAVCVGNIHGMTRHPSQLDMDRLSRISECCTVPLVLHGASGLSDAILREAVKLGVAKVNVNTELRLAYLKGLQSAEAADLVPALPSGRAAAKEAAASTMRALGTWMAAQRVSGKTSGVPV